MKKTFNIYDYKGTPTEITINDFEKIKLIFIVVISGDEELHVIYKNCTCEVYETNCDRNIDYFDGLYIIYNSETDKDLIFDKRWLNSTASYERLQLYDQD